MKQILLSLFCLALLAPSIGHVEESKIFINVGEAQTKKSLIAFPALSYIGTQTTNAFHLRTGQNLFSVMQNDLNVSNFFTFISPSAFLEDPNKVGLKPAPGSPNGFNFAKWKSIDTEFLVRAAYQVVGDDLSMETYVYHVPTTKLVMGKMYRAKASEYRSLAHTFANDLMFALTGKKGMFFTKLTASRQDTAFNPKIKNSGSKEIYVLDWDGANVKKISSHSTISLSPTWSNDGKKVAYTSFAYHIREKVRNPDLFVYDLESEKRLMVSYRKGLNSGAAYFPNDREMLITLTKSGSPDIYRMSADGVSLKQITNGPNRAMNVEPAISPDGSMIAFSSDRSGRPMIYVMKVDGTDAKRITNAGKYNSSPAWSPDGKTLAFAGYDKNHFDIFTISATGANLKRLTDARKPNGKPADNESPSWSPDGRNIVFSSNRTGTSQLYMVSPDGTSERRITNDSHNWERPKWSPYLD